MGITSTRRREIAWVLTGPRLGGALSFFSGLLFTASVLALPTSWHHADTENLLQALQDGGLVIYVRHGEAETEEDDTTRLTEGGCEQLAATAAALEEADIGAETVLSSPTTRTMQSARLLFPEAEIRSEDKLDMERFTDAETRGTLVAALRELLARPTDGGNRWLIGHITPLVMALDTPFGGDDLPVGTMAVFLPEGDGRFTHVGNLPPHWGLAEADTKTGESPGDFSVCEQEPPSA
ncbi:histidine phosphatase family protein [Methylonatrum kenyense]|uniref:histidine phosphatase family protein n=1 Tax=Methylonatrum kenyense TaxID=455253 RepID=UPI0020C139CD|nr:histidine phosphatase family protein [Methylonatrum kenyense]